jgi:SOS response regulatory protein OraA/RecX
MKEVKTKSLDLINKGLSAAERELARQVQNGRTEVITWMKLNHKASGQVRQYLRDKGYSDDLITDIIGSLIEDGYLNDIALARNLVKQREGRRSESHAALRQRMLRHGISEEAIDQTLPDANLDLEKASELVEKQFSRQITELGLYASHLENNSEVSTASRMQRKISQYLAGRGFDLETIARVLKNYFPDMDIMDG